MEECSFDKLVQLLGKKLSLGARLKVFDHLDKCEICRDTVYHIARDRDEAAGILSVRRKKTGSRQALAERRGFELVQGSTTPSHSLARNPVTGTHG
jgi:hypothetical protein